MVGAEVYLHLFLASALDEDEWLTSRPGHLTPRERTSGLGLGGPHSRARRFGEKFLDTVEIRAPGRPA